MLRCRRTVVRRTAARVALRLRIRGRRRVRQIYNELRTDTVAGACTHGAAMRGHCLTYHGEPQSGSAGLEREVRLEQAIDAVDRDAVARVCDRHLHTRIARTDAYREL